MDRAPSHGGTSEAEDPHDWQGDPEIFERLERLRKRVAADKAAAECKRKMPHAKIEWGVPNDD